ncbi:T9SS type A sorting domain-containing protein [Chryseobacterium sp. FH1]|uniref:T9SS type A sorting domain-containing protein n=1 Tax=Chryseobacterium sp. FH1 TaxID=1233951 RepID=UPI0004E2F70D|nr:T9SS type A sorting domain-containing protein [Chryseobacterium sp. FH1]KFC20251.1 hypothetical protein IO90_13785 [Chryseobacterium sp. FH1]
MKKTIFFSTKTRWKSFFVIIFLLSFKLSAQTITTVASGLNQPLGLAIKDNTLFISEYGAGKVSKIDISQPLPAPVTTILNNINRTTGLYIINNYLYIASEENLPGHNTSVGRINIESSNPTIEPITTNLNSTFITQAFVQNGNDLYISSSSTLSNQAGIYKVRLDQAFPQAATSIITNNPCSGMAIKGDELYFSYFYGTEVKKINLNQPNPSITSVASGLRGPDGIMFNGNFLYISEATGTTIKRKDISNANSSLETMASGLQEPSLSAFNGLDLYFAEYAGGKVSKLTINQPAFPNIPPVCSNITTQNLGGASPVGGVYSGLGVTDNGDGKTFSFNTMIAGGIGNHNITYNIAGNTVIGTLQVISCDQVVNIPDANFKAYLVGNTVINTNGDNEIQVSEAEDFAGEILCQYKNISDLTGVEAFTKITKLDCGGNQLTSVDVSKNTNLTTLWTGNNLLTSLDVSSNTTLTDFACNNNSQLTSLNIKNGNNTILTKMYADFNSSLTCIQVDNVANANSYTTAGDWKKDATASYNTNCTSTPIVNIPDANFKAYLLSVATINTNGDAEIQVSEAESFTGDIVCFSKSISSLVGIEAFTKITWLNCADNKLTNLDVSQNIALTILSCHSNQLTTLDLSSNTALKSVFLNTNKLISLNLKNGNNSAITTMNATNNPNLTCIQVDNATVVHTGWTKDATASYNTNCNPDPIVYIPDTNFKAYLVSNTAINTNGDTEIQVSEAEAFTGDINASSKNIARMVGIEAFVKITKLECQFNQILSLDISKNTLLTYLDCSENLITNLDISKNIVLTDLRCRTNRLPNLDISKNTLLTHLNCRENLLTSLNLKNNNNNILATMWTNENPSLTCIQVDNVTNANSYSGWMKDNTASYNTLCNNHLAVFQTSKSELVLYPNPVKDILNFSEEVSSIKISDISGRTVKQAPASAKSVNVATLEKGTYIITATTKAGNTITKKLVKE